MTSTRVPGVDDDSPLHDMSREQLMLLLETFSKFDDARYPLILATMAAITDIIEINNDSGWFKLRRIRKVLKAHKERLSQLTG